MKRMSRIPVAAAAAFLLTFSVVSQATDVAMRPVAGTALIFPNLIFGVDDSGSMDWEVLFTNNNGVAWWNRATGSIWNADGSMYVPNIPSGGTNASPNNADHRTIAYVFPLGLHTADVFDGKNVYYGDGLVGGSGTHANPSWGNVAMPTAEFAAIRSNFYNTIYYDPTRTYVPWKDRYDATSTADPKSKSYGPASPTAAKSHPEQSATDGVTLDLTTDQPADTTTFRFFTAFSGNSIPKDARYRAVVPGNAPQTWVTAAADMVLPNIAGNRGAYNVAMPYYPATFWIKESCSVPVPLTPLSDCAPAPGGSTLKRYEIRSTTTTYTHTKRNLNGSIVLEKDASGTMQPVTVTRTYAEEMQNFANWFTYYRKRQNMLAAAMGELIDGLTGVKIGLAKMNGGIPTGSSSWSDPPAVTMYDADSPDYALNGRKLLEQIYTQQIEAKGTPTRELLKFIGQQYMRSDSNAPIKYSCQRNNALIVTDGFASPNNVTSGLTYPTSTYFSGSPYTTIHSPSIADIASAFYATNLRNGRTDLSDGKVEPEAVTAVNADRNKNLHMNTYGLTLGSEGTLWKRNASGAFPSQMPVSGITWPNPVQQSPAAVDDLWHATINGRGQMYTSIDAAETAEALEEALADILNKGGTQTGVGVLSVNLSEGDRAYLASFNSAGWWGDFSAYQVQATDGLVKNEDTDRLWSAAAKLDARNFNDRVLITFKGGSGVPFNSTTIGATELTTSPAITGVTAAQVVDYHRGDRSLEESIPVLLRKRASRMGAIINAQPAIDTEEKVGYVPASDGFVHAIDLTDGKELWAYMPSAVLPRLRTMAKKTWSFSTVLDGTPTVSRVAGSKILVGGMGAGGAGYYALNIQDPKNPLSAADRATKVLWEFPASSSNADVKNQVGMSVGRPLFVRINGTGAQAVLLTSGFNTPAASLGKGRVFVLNPATGEFMSGFGPDTFKTPDGVASVGPSATGEAGLTYLTPFVEPDGTVQFVYGGDLLGNVWRFDLVAKELKRVALLKDASGNLQPIAAPVGTANFRGKRVLVVGTGKILGQSDFISQAVIDSNTFKTQSVYVFTETDGTTLEPRVGTSMVKQTLTIGTNNENRILTNPSPVDWSTKRGWYLDLLKGERANTRPFILDGNVVFVTNTPNLDACRASAFLYRLDFLTAKESFKDLAGVRVSYTYTASGLGVRTTKEGTKIILHRNENDGAAPPDTCIGNGDVITCGNRTDKGTSFQKNAWRQVLRED